METTYNINKIYHGYESRNRKGYEKNLTLEQAKHSLDVTESLWVRNGGSIVERTEDSLTVEESDGSMTITFEIVEE